MWKYTTPWKRALRWKRLAKRLRQQRDQNATQNARQRRLLIWLLNELSGLGSVSLVAGALSSVQPNSRGGKA